MAEPRQRYGRPLPTVVKSGAYGNYQFTVTTPEANEQVIITISETPELDSTAPPSVVMERETNDHRTLVQRVQFAPRTRQGSIIFQFPEYGQNAVKEFLELAGPALRERTGRNATRGEMPPGAGGIWAFVKGLFASAQPPREHTDER